jgi:hypothetical protein
LDLNDTGEIRDWEGPTFLGHPASATKSPVRATKPSGKRSSGRSTLKLPELVELFLLCPLVTVPLAAKLLEVTPEAVDLMLIPLGDRGLPAAPATTLGHCLGPLQVLTSILSLQAC